MSTRYCSDYSVPAHKSKIFDSSSYHRVLMAFNTLPRNIEHWQTIVVLRDCLENFCWSIHSIISKILYVPKYVFNLLSFRKFVIILPVEI